ncbi:MAG: FAD-dependent oxidoreductase [Desulfobacteraceae bacterium]|nr:FAD-dependent oxidoreductase [Desulfobacteraceae bacterium]
MADKKYDVVVIGSGVGGMGAAALLAKNFQQKVLVLEKAPFIGGRTLSVVGNGDKVEVDGQKLDAEGFRRAFEMNSTWAFTAEGTPTLDEIFKKGLLDGYTYDSGHGLFWGNKSRIRCVLDYLEVPVDMPTNTGFAYVDYMRNKTYQVEKRQKYPWMSDEGFKATMHQLRDMATTDLGALPKLMDVPLQKWLEDRNMHQEAYDWIKNLIGSQTANNVPAKTPAGDFLGYQAIAGDIKMNLVDGSVATISQPGITAIPLAFEESLNANGGEVWRNSPVVQTIIENERVKGVVVRTKNGFETIKADRVICNVPPMGIHSVIHPRHFDQKWVRKIHKRFWNPGLLSAIIGLKRDIWAEKGIDERSFVFMPACISEYEGFEGGAMDVVMWNMASCAKDSVARPSLSKKPGRAPEGKRDFCFSLPQLGHEMRTPANVKRLTEFCEKWFKRFWPNWKEDVEFWIWTPCDRAYGDWRPVGEERPDVESPWVENLYFVGDQYGKRMWGGGVDGAGLCSVMTVDAMMGTNLEEEIFPEYHQGLPKKRTW